MYGFSVKNENNITTVDTTSPNLFLRDKGVVNATSVGVSLPARDLDSLVFLKSSSHCVLIDNKVYVNSSSPTPVSYYIFSKALPTSKPNFGLVVYNETGGINFSSDEYPLRIYKDITSTKESTGWFGREFIPVAYSDNLGVGSGSFAWCTFNLRVYWSSVQMYTAKGDFVTDSRRRIRTVRVDGGGIIHFDDIMTFFYRDYGLWGNYNYSPNASSPNTMLLIDTRLYD